MVNEKVRRCLAYGSIYTTWKLQIIATWWCYRHSNFHVVSTTLIHGFHGNAVTMATKY